MKSIKEKSIEYNKKKNFVCKGDVPNEDFETGANYVLDAIENILNADRILGNPFPTTEMRLDAIIDTIKQLKNNQ